jgi:hypothetical protein
MLARREINNSRRVGEIKEDTGEVKDTSLGGRGGFFPGYVPSFFSKGQYESQHVNANFFYIIYIDIRFLPHRKHSKFILQK